MGIFYYRSCNNLLMTYKLFVYNSDSLRFRWFAGFNWGSLERKEMTPPFRPHINGPIDTSNFDECPKDKEIPPDEFGDWSKDF